MKTKYSSKDFKELSRVIFSNSSKVFGFSFSLSKAVLFFSVFSISVESLSSEFDLLGAFFSTIPFSLFS